MKTYLVQWSIDIEAKSPREAAIKAREFIRDPEMIANSFRVLSEREGWLDFLVYDDDASLIHNDTIDLEESIEEP